MINKMRRFELRKIAIKYLKDLKKRDIRDSDEMIILAITENELTLEESCYIGYMMGKHLGVIKQ